MTCKCALVLLGCGGRSLQQLCIKGKEKVGNRHTQYTAQAAERRGWKVQSNLSFIFRVFRRQTFVKTKNTLKEPPDGSVCCCSDVQSVFLVFPLLCSYFSAFFSCSKLQNDLSARMSLMSCFVGFAVWFAAMHINQGKIGLWVSSLSNFFCQNIKIISTILTRKCGFS